MPSNHLILCCPLILLPWIFPRNPDGVFPMSWLFASGGLGTGALAPVLPMNIQTWFLLGLTGMLQSMGSQRVGHNWATELNWGLTGLISLLFKGLWRVLWSTKVQKHQFFGAQPSFGESNGNPLQYTCLENPMDGGAWWAAVHGVAKCQTWLSNFTFTFHFHALEKEMATHSSVLAWRIPATGKPGGLPSMGSHRVGHDWSDLATYTFSAINF